MGKCDLKVLLFCGNTSAEVNLSPVLSEKLVSLDFFAPDVIRGSLFVENCHIY